MVVEPLAADIAHRARLAEESLDGGQAEGDDDLGFDKLDLLGEPREAGRHLGRLRFAVTRLTIGHVGAALEDVRNEDLLTRVVHGADDLGEELARLADEGFTAQILLLSGGLADEEQFREGIADPVDHLRTAGDEIRTESAGEDFLFENLQLCEASVVGRCGNREGSRYGGRGGRILHRVDGGELLETGECGRRFLAETFLHIPEDGERCIEGLMEGFLTHDLESDAAFEGGIGTSPKSAGRGASQRIISPVEGWVNSSRQAWRRCRSNLSRLP